MATLLKTSTLTDIDAYSYADWYKIKVEVYLNSQTNTADKCSSNITIKRFFGTQKAKAGWSGYYSPKITSSISVNGGSFGNSSSTTIDKVAQDNAGAWIQFGSWTGDIAHRTDGTQSINVKLAYTSGTTTSYICKDASLTTGVFDLPTIPRESKLGEIPKFDIDMGFVFNADKPSETSYRKLVVKNGEVILREILEEDLVNGYEYLLSDDINTIYSIMSNEFEHTFTFDLYTYSDSTMATQLGNPTTQTAVGYVTDCTPTFYGFDCVNSDESSVSLTGSDQIYIPNYSDATITINTPAVAYKGATIVGYNINGYGYLPVSEYPMTYTIKDINSSFNIQAIDSRGSLSNAIQKNITWVNGYKVPEIRNFDSARNGGIGTDIYLSFSGAIWEGNFGNGNNEVVRVAYRVKPRDGEYGEWFDITNELNLDGLTAFRITEESGIQLHANGESGGFSAGLSYTVQLVMYDGANGVMFNPAIAEVVIQDGYVLDSYYKSESGYRFAINGIVDPEGDVLQVYDDNGNLINIVDNVVDMVYPVGSIYINATNLNPETLFKGTKWERFGKGRTLVGLDEEDEDFATVNKEGGAKTHLLTAAQSGLQAHNHTQASHSHKIGRDKDGGSGSNRYTVHGDGTSGADATSPTSSVTPVINNCEAKDATEAHNNLQPYITVYMWKRIG